MSNACTVAVNEWRLLDRHPMARVRRPADNESRQRRPTSEEIDALLHVCGYRTDEAPTTKMSRVGAAILFGVETAMRAGEICGMLWPDVEVERRFCRTHGKTPASRREVPLSAEALRILAQLESVREGESVFQLQGASLDALFRKARDKAMIEDLHFHDFRHEGITRLSRRLPILALARAVDFPHAGYLVEQ